MGTGPVVGCTGVIHDEIDCIRARIPDPQKCQACTLEASRPLRALVRLWGGRVATARAYADELEREIDAVNEDVARRFPQLYAKEERS